jgi:hypothetical protein
LSGIQFVGAPTGRESRAGRIARRNFEFVTYHTTRIESIENRKETRLPARIAAEYLLEELRTSHDLNFSSIAVRQTMVILYEIVDLGAGASSTHSRHI